MSVSFPVDHNGVVRPTANYHPNLWGDHFLTHTSSDDLVAEECKEEVQNIEELKEQVRKELIKDSCADKSSSSKLLKLIDTVQLLGLAYHFENEIQEALKGVYGKYGDLLDDHDEDLTNASLRFRLLRQQGYPVSSDVFNKFKDKDGNFKESLIGDTHGMLALYEAAHLMLRGEDILEEALTFTTTHLHSIIPSDHPNNPLLKQVIHALNRPIRKSLTRVEARHYISIYQQDHDDSHNNKSLLKLAKLDFNLLQSLHRKELGEITRWWKGLDLATKLPFVRDRLVESYFWTLGVYYEPQYFLARRFLTKVIALIAIIDDIYDAYGTFEELQLLTEVIERWDCSCIDQLPANYLRLVYQALLGFFEEIGEEMAIEGKLYRVHYPKEAMKSLVQAYFVEAKWLNQGYTPTFEEYLSNASVTSCHSVLMTTSFIAMGDAVTEEALQWVLDRAPMIRASEIIGRLMDDIVSHEFERSRMHIPTSVECYMKQYGVTKQEAYNELNKQIVNAWKDINQECLIIIPAQLVPAPIIVRVLNFVCVEDVIYKDGDEYTHVGKWMKNLIALTLIDPVPT